MTKLSKINNYLQERGPLWTVLYILRLFCMRFIQYTERHLINIERRKLLIGEGTISNLCHTIDQNRKIWDNHDWSQFGEEWTMDVRKYKGLEPSQWKDNIIHNMMFKYIKNDSTVIEIGPGAGRWTVILQRICHHLVLIDISEKCLTICREQFKEYDNITYHMINDIKLDFIDDNSVDYIWSYDVFVHINPYDTEKYMKEFSRILKPGGCAIIHHPGMRMADIDRNKILHYHTEEFRSYMDSRIFTYLIKKYDMKLIEQNDSLPHMSGDVISVFLKPNV